MFQPTLNFRVHIENVISESNKYLSIISRIACNFNLWAPLLLLYNLLVRSHLTYASLVWAGSSKYLNDKLESVQIRFVKLI